MPVRTQAKIPLETVLDAQRNCCGRNGRASRRRVRLHEARSSFSRESGGGRLNGNCEWAGAQRKPGRVVLLQERVDRVSIPAFGLVNRSVRSVGATREAPGHRAVVRGRFCPARSLAIDPAQRNCAGIHAQQCERSQRGKRCFVGHDPIMQRALLRRNPPLPSIGCKDQRARR